MELGNYLKGSKASILRSDNTGNLINSGYYGEMLVEIHTPVRRVLHFEIKDKMPEYHRTYKVR